jgi:hypothetical protein
LPLIGFPQDRFAIRENAIARNGAFRRDPGQIGAHGRLLAFARSIPCGNLIISFGEFRSKQLVTVEIATIQKTAKESGLGHGWNNC